MRKFIALCALAASLVVPSAALGVNESDGGTVCGRNNQGTYLQFYVNGSLHTYYCSNSGDPLNGPFHWIE